MMEIKNEKISRDEFFQIRKDVLNQWPTGKEVNLEDAIAFHKSLPSKKIFSKNIDYKIKT